MYYAQDVKPLFRWFTKNKFRWFLLAISVIPMSVIVYTIKGFVEGVKEWKKGFNLQNAGYWHNKGESSVSDRYRDGRGKYD
ncbi:hypothetical protein LCGC14_1428490 [marine sediment metagenome]|uniref:Uncharacterized protein n=1 Tax=marine sediment metagenome TaxID=412755 RepID=A0A0F9M4R2_9ZZZZ